jgi:hypothetical protein
MFLHPHRIEAEVLGPRDFLERLSVVMTAFDGDEADLEPCHAARA